MELRNYPRTVLFLPIHGRSERRQYEAVRLRFLILFTQTLATMTTLTKIF